MLLFFLLSLHICIHETKSFKTLIAQLHNIYYIYIIFIDDLTYEGLELLGLICYFAQKHPQNIRYTVVFYLLLVILLTLLLLFSIFIH